MPLLPPSIRATRASTMPREGYGAAWSAAGPSAEPLDEGARPGHPLVRHHELVGEGVAERPGRVDAELGGDAALVSARVEQRAQAPGDDHEVAVGLHAAGDRPHDIG